MAYHHDWPDRWGVLTRWSVAWVHAWEKFGSDILTLGLCQNISNILDIIRPYQILWLLIISQFLETNHVDPFCFSDRNEVQKLWWSMSWEPWSRLVSLVAVASELWRFSGLFLSCLSLSTLWPVGWEKSCDSTEVQHYRKYLRLKDPVERPMWWHNDDALPQNPQNDKSGHRMLCSEREGIRGPAKIAVITGNSSFHTNHQPTHCFTFGKLQPGYIVQRQYDPKTQRQLRAPAIRATAFSPGRNWVSWMKRMCSGWPRALSSFGLLQPSTVSLACLAFVWQFFAHGKCPFESEPFRVPQMKQLQPVPEGWKNSWS